MLNEFALQKLGWQRLQEGLQAAERERLVREAQGRPQPAALTAVERVLFGGATDPDDGGRIPPDAPRTGEMSSL